MNKKKLFGVLASAAMLLNATPLSVFAEEMVEVGPTGTVVGADPTNVALNSTNFPDNNLLNAIKSQNVSAATAADVKELEVPNSVQSLEGLQYLTSLESFTMINNNYIQSVDLSNNTALAGSLENANGTVVNPELQYSGTYTAPVTIQNNGVLTSVTLPNDEDLTAVVITGNASLNEIDLSPAVLLEDVILSNNSIDELNLSKNPYIQFLDVSRNDLYELDATGCKQLTALNVNNNKIFELKVPTAVPNGLQVLWANHNKLATFSVENLTKLVDLDLSNNMLKSLTLGSQAFSSFNVSYNHLAALKLNKVSFNGTKPIVSPQNLYANATDAAVNIKDYDPSFDPDQATLPGDKPFNSNGIFNTTNHPDEGTLAQFTQSGTTIYYLLGDNGKITGVKVLLNGVFVPAGNYTLSPDPVAEGMTPAEFASTPITITAVKGTHYTGSVIIPNANKKGKAISNPNELIIKATASGTMNKDGVTVVVDPAVLLAATWSELTNPQYTVSQVTGQAIVDGVTWNLKFTKVASDPDGYTWTAKAIDATQEDAPIWNEAPTKVIISGEITVTADNLAGPLTTSFNNVVLEGDNSSVTVSNDQLDDSNGTIGGDATIDVDNSGNAGDEEPGEGDELAVTLSGTGITAVAGKTGVYTVAATENPVDLATVVLVNGNAVDGETITYTEVKDANGTALDTPGTPTTVGGDNKGPQDPGFYKIEVTNADDETGSVILQITGDDEGEASKIVVTAPSAGTYQGPSTAAVPATLAITDNGTDVTLTFSTANKTTLASGGTVNITQGADTYTVTFKKGNTATAPVDTGTYSITVTKGSDTSAAVEYTIDPLNLSTGATVSVTLSTTTSDWTKIIGYDGSNNKIPAGTDIVGAVKSISITPTNGTAFDVTTLTGWEVKPSADITWTPANTSLASGDTITVGTLSVKAPTNNANYATAAGSASVSSVALTESAEVVESSTVGITGSDSYYLYNTSQTYNSSNIIMQVNVVKEDLMNRLYNPNSGEHFYTKDTHEKDVLVELGWQYEGIGWVAPIDTKIPVYRLYNPNAGDHHYTKDVNERDTLVRVGWNYEGIGWYSAKEGNNENFLIKTETPSFAGMYDTGYDSVDGLEVFREYNPNAEAAGAHNYTVSEVENNVLVSIGWLDEGIAWYALK